MSVRILAVLNHKGGVGKTTTNFNLACACACACACSDQTLNILAIDLDPQSHLCVSLGSKEQTLSDMDDVFLDHADACGYIFPIRENLDPLPSGFRLGEIGRLAAQGRQQAVVLRGAIQPIQSNFDLIFIHCPATSGLLNFNTLFAASEIIIPVSSDYLVLHGLSQLLRTLKSAEKFILKQLQL